MTLSRGYAIKGNLWSKGMTTRSLWTLQRADRVLQSSLASVAELTTIIADQPLPGIAPAGWIVAGLLKDEDESGSASHVSPLGWTLSIKQMQV